MKARLSTDGGARGNPGPAAYGYVLETEDGHVLAARGEAIGRATNNVAEYSGLVAGLEKAAELGVRELEVVSDSELLEPEREAGRLLAVHVEEPSLDVVRPAEVVTLAQLELPALARRRPVLEDAREDGQVLVHVDRQIALRALLGRLPRKYVQFRHAKRVPAAGPVET